MATIKHFEDLEMWQLAREFSKIALKTDLRKDYKLL